MKRCAPSARANALFANADIVVLDGARSDCDWNHDPSARVPGLTPAKRMPVLIRNDWVQNSNDSYWFSNPAVTIPNMSPLVGQLNMPLRLRTRSAIGEIRGYLAGTDGAAGNKIGMREVQELIFRNRNKAGQLVVPDLIKACANSTDSEIHEGCMALQGWDLSNNIDSRGAPLFREFWREARNIPNVWRVPFNATDPLNTPTGLNFTDATTTAKVLEALAKSVRTIKKAGFASDATLGAVQFKNIGNTRIAIHGGDEFEGVLNKIGTIGPVALNENGFVVDFGTSYIQSVTFDERGPIAQALLTYGQSSDPASKFSYDQLPNYSRKQWIDLPFHANDVDAKLVEPAVRLLR
jgi:acyl-homoserine-lactone acylase